MGCSRAWTGTYGASAPGLSTYLAGNLVGNIVPDDVGDNIAQAEGLPIGGPSATPPVGFAVQVAPGEYTIVVFNSYLCGGCVTRVTVDVSHPKSLGPGVGYVVERRAVWSRSHVRVILGAIEPRLERAPSGPEGLDARDAVWVVSRSIVH